MTRNLTLTLLGCLTLVACGTPQEQCISQNTREYRVVSNLLREVEANLARGYAWEEREVTRTEWRDCPVVVRDKDGNARWIDRLCAGPCSRPVRRSGIPVSVTSPRASPDRRRRDARPPGRAR